MAKQLEEADAEEQALAAEKESRDLEVPAGPVEPQPDSPAVEPEAPVEPAKVPVTQNRMKSWELRLDNQEGLDLPETQPGVVEGLETQPAALEIAETQLDASNVNEDDSQKLPSPNADRVVDEPKEVERPVSTPVRASRVATATTTPVNKSYMRARDCREPLTPTEMEETPVNQNRLLTDAYLTPSPAEESLGSPGEEPLVILSVHGHFQLHTKWFIERYSPKLVINTNAPLYQEKRALVQECRDFFAKMALESAFDEVVEQSPAPVASGSANVEAVENSPSPPSPSASQLEVVRMF